MSQVLRFVKELNTAMDPLYAYLKTVVRKLHKHVDRKLRPLFDFLASVLAPRYALLVAKSLYKRFIRSVGHIVSLPQYDGTPVPLRAALIEARWPEDPEIIRQVISNKRRLTCGSESNRFIIFRCRN